MQNTMSEIPNPSEMASSLIHKHGKQLAMRLAMEETIKAQGKTIIIPSVSGETWSVFWEILDSLSELKRGRCPFALFIGRYRVDIVKNGGELMR